MTRIPYHITYFGRVEKDVKVHSSSPMILESPHQQLLSTIRYEKKKVKWLSYQYKYAYLRRIKFPTFEKPSDLYDVIRSKKAHTIMDRELYVRHDLYQYERACAPHICLSGLKLPPMLYLQGKKLGSFTRPVLLVEDQYFSKNVGKIKVHRRTFVIVYTTKKPELRMFCRPWTASYRLALVRSPNGFLVYRTVVPDVTPDTRDIGRPVYMILHNKLEFLYDVLEKWILSQINPCFSIYLGKNKFYSSTVFRKIPVRAFKKVLKIRYRWKVLRRAIVNLSFGPVENSVKKEIERIVFILLNTKYMSREDEKLACEAYSDLKTLGVKPILDYSGFIQKKALGKYCSPIESFFSVNWSNSAQLDRVVTWVKTSAVLKYLKSGSSKKNIVINYLGSSVKFNKVATRRWMFRFVLSAGLISHITIPRDTLANNDSSDDEEELPDVDDHSYDSDLGDYELY
jgi:hypothetical protein